MNRSGWKVYLASVCVHCGDLATLSALHRQLNVTEGSGDLGGVAYLTDAEGNVLVGLPPTFTPKPKSTTPPTPESPTCQSPPSTLSDAPKEKKKKDKKEKKEKKEKKDKKKVTKRKDSVLLNFPTGDDDAAPTITSADQQAAPEEYGPREE
ncbi:serine/arginine repetitive matrix protein 1-like [Denticeps clupeoides]|uniref:serine/arginine repetitive matrix protein 1-like n=1 Tax=Denticeps clupeoides TaxID=299321 RepID=UPI0010A42EB1|nr:serine/arginine repetitive matrix protein 1-like [Denticeps clupeoides]